MNRVVGTHDILLITLDTLRFDVAQDLWHSGRTPHMARVLPSTGWEERHTPGNFTFAAHAAFFAGFLPTPAVPSPPGNPKPERLFAVRFEGSETATERTCVFDAPDIVTGLAGRGYHTVCIGGVGFFNPASPLGRVLPAPFAERHWRSDLGVTDRNSTENQVALAIEILARTPVATRLFIFVNVSAIHQPNCHYVAGANQDSLGTHGAALEYVDRHLGRLFEAVASRGPAFGVLCSDHGTAYGEEGYWGHRLSHPTVWTVPYAEIFLNAGEASA